MKNTGTLKVTTPTDREIVLTRVFDAPRHLVFDAFTKPELLKRWFGPRGWSLAVCEVDFCSGRRRPLIVMRCYFDGSQGDDDTGDQWLTLAGYTASDLFWGRFQQTWEQMLRERYPIAPYLHMWELVSGNDPFERKAGWTEDKVHELIIDAAQLLQGFDKSKFCAFTCTISLSARDRLIAEGSEIPDPVEICSNVCVGSSFLWYFQEHSDDVEMAYMFFDQGEPFMNGIRNLWLKRHRPLNQVSLEPFWGLIANVQPLDMRDSPSVQAADLVAWSISRGLSDRERPWKYWHRFSSEIDLKAG